MTVVEFLLCAQAWICWGQDTADCLDTAAAALEPRRLWHGRTVGIQVYTNAHVSEADCSISILYTYFTIIASEASFLVSSIALTFAIILYIYIYIYYSAAK